MKLLIASFTFFLCPISWLFCQDKKTADVIHTFVISKMPGYSGVILVALDDQIVYEHAFGYKDMDTQTPNTVETEFKIGSMTKAFTAVAILELEEKGRLRTQDKISLYLQGLPSTWQDITIHELLTHTSGLMHSWDLPTFTEYLLEQREIGLTEIIEQYYQYPLTSKGVFRYSGLGYFILAQLIEVITDTKYNEYLDGVIFKPLDMKSTYGFALEKEGSALAVGYDSDIPTKSKNSGFMYGGGNLVSNAKDLYKFHLELSRSTIINDESTKKLFSPFVQIDERSYGYGWYIQNKGDLTFAFHGGSVPPGFRSYFLRIPEKNLFMVLLSNKPIKMSRPIVDEFANVVASLTN